MNSKNQKQNNEESIKDTEKLKQLRRQKIKTSQKLFRYEPHAREKDESSGKTQDIFSTFLYRDHVTRNRYQFAKLKNLQKIKTSPDEAEISKKNNANDGLNSYTQQLKLLLKIKENRNHELRTNYRSKQKQKNSNHNRYLSANITNGFQHFQIMQNTKKKIRKQILSLNHQFLREYLYHHQPFNKMLVQINQYEKAGVINESKINELQKKIIKCMKEGRQNEPGVKQASQQKKYKPISQKKNLKDKEDKRIDKKFDKVWEQIKGQIRRKVKMQGEYNLYRTKFKR